MPGTVEIGQSRREQQITDIVYQRGKATVAEVLGDLPDPPSYSAIRALMRILEEKGRLKHGKAGAKYVYTAVRPRRKAAQSAISRLLRTFFDGSAEKAMVALLGTSESKLTKEQLDRLSALIEKAKKQKR